MAAQVGELNVRLKAIEAMLENIDFAKYTRLVTELTTKIRALEAETINLRDTVTQLQVTQQALAKASAQTSPALSAKTQTPPTTTKK